MISRNQNVALRVAHVQPSRSSRPNTARLRTAPGGGAYGAICGAAEGARRAAGSAGSADGAGDPPGADDPPGASDDGASDDAGPPDRSWLMRSPCIAWSWPGHG